MTTPRPATTVRRGYDTPAVTKYCTRCGLAYTDAHSCSAPGWTCAIPMRLHSPIDPECVFTDPAYDAPVVSYPHCEICRAVRLILAEEPSA